MSSFTTSVASNLLGESILGSVKQYIGFDLADPSYDSDCLSSIGTSIFILRQRGLQVPEGFAVTSLDQTWSDMLGTGAQLEGVRSYFQKRGKLDVDPPTNSFAISAIEKQISELEFRIAIEVDPAYKSTEGGTSK